MRRECVVECCGKKERGCCKRECHYHEVCMKNMIEVHGEKDCKVIEKPYCKKREGRPFQQCNEKNIIKLILPSDD